MALDGICRTYLEICIDCCQNSPCEVGLRDIEIGKTPERGTGIFWGSGDPGKLGIDYKGGFGNSNLSLKEHLKCFKRITLKISQGIQQEYSQIVTTTD